MGIILLRKKINKNKRSLVIPMLTTYFEFGEVYCTPSVKLELMPEEICQLLAWHGQLKRGELGEEDYLMNQKAIKTEERVFSCYRMNGERYYVITESDRSYTTILRPEEY